MTTLEAPLPPGTGRVREGDTAPRDSGSLSGLERVRRIKAE